MKVYLLILILIHCCLISRSNQQSTSTSSCQDPITSMSKARSVHKKLLSVEQAEGVGARVRRSIGRPELGRFDPFLMFDEAHVKPPAGFPDHPHRGFETVSYLLSGKFKHEDFAGHKGILSAGGLQWMTAGRGIVHSEIPIGDEVSRGFQLWVNLPAKYKMVEPRYQELESKDVPEVTKDGVTVRVISGQSMGVSSPVKTYTPTMYLDFRLAPNASFKQEVPPEWNAFLYTIDGSVFVGNDTKSTDAHYTITLTLGDFVEVRAGENGAHFILLAGQPIGEPVAQYGPFVMNTQQEIREAFVDYQMGRNGFERALNWQSEAQRNRNVVDDD